MMKKHQILFVISALFVTVCWSSISHSLIAAHFNYNGCFTCHRLHNGPSQNGPLLTDLDSESTCLGCHGPLSIATEVAIHDPNSYGSGTLGYVTCLECHNPHTNGDPSEPTVPTDWPNVDGNYNTKMIGMKHDFNDTINNPRPRLPVPQIRQEFRLPTDTDPIALGALQNVIFESTPADWGRADQRGLCNMCHGATHNTGLDCSSCHGHDDSFRGAGCTGCHDGLGAGALSISSASPHSETATGYSCEDCHTGHSAGTIEIPNNTAVGIDYGSNGESGIALGSAVATGGTEAEICWSCHATEGVSEWGLNSDTNGTFPDFDFGSLSGALAPNWVNTAGDTGATWTSANFTYKTSAIQSTHAVDGAATGPGLDPVGNIRCSYCHDVHELNALTTDSSSGKPYLRGTWVGNPYMEDGAPSNDIAGGLPGDVADYSAHLVREFGAVPRGSTAYTELGGYYIDQNSGSPTTDTALDHPDEFAGLCLLCHEGTSGTPGNGTWEAAEIDNLNEFGTPGTDWVSNSNSHARIVKGGSGSGAVNLFTLTKRHPTTGWAMFSGAGSEGGNPVMAYKNARSSTYSNKDGIYVFSNEESRGLRGIDNVAFQYNPPVDTANRQYNFRYYDWGATVVIEDPSDGTMSDSGIDVDFHQFTCSKCHNPHASRLPRLMITNCLDTKHNAWDDAFVTPASDTNGASDALVAENQSISVSQMTSAQNCHRLADPGFANAGPQGTTTGGWNRVTPW